MKMKMQKHRWAIVAAVCVLALIVVGAVFLPRILSNGNAAEQVDIVKPGYWWKTDLNEQQLASLASLWGENITMAQLIEAVWPGVLQEIPAEAASSLGGRAIGWHTDQPDGKGNVLTMDDSLGYSMVFCAGFSSPAVQPDAEPERSFYYYIGTEAWERSTLVNRDSDRTSDMLYRIPIYTDDVRSLNPSPPPGSVHL
jgi:hypothetical protein